MSQAFACQWCGHEYTHHYFVEVCDRAEDDDNTNVVGVVTRGGKFGEIHSEDAMDFQCTVGVHPSSNVPNPSPRRHGVNIEVICEDCRKLSVIHVWQHKGQTIVSGNRVGLTQ